MLIKINNVILESTQISHIKPVMLMNKSIEYKVFFIHNSDTVCISENSYNKLCEILNLN